MGKIYVSRGVIKMINYPMDFVLGVAIDEYEFPLNMEEFFHWLN